jgi:hypothetical protein
MEASRRDSTRDWLLPAHRTPPSIGELEARIDEALATARASEAAVVSVGEAALDAAQQARRAAELAERASAAVLAQAPPPGAAAQQPPPPPEVAAGARRARRDGDGGLRDFIARADRLAERLRELERRPPVAIG